MTDHQKASLSYISLLTILMFGFQNCGEQPISDELLDSGGQSELVQIVDQWAPEHVSFYEKLIEVDVSQDEIDVTGFCHRDQEGEQLNWVVVSSDDNEDILMEGESLCERAGFSMIVSSLDQLDCGNDYRIFVESLNGEEDMMQLHRSCE